jgi:hypothetical protein
MTLFIQEEKVTSLTLYMYSTQQKRCVRLKSATVVTSTLRSLYPPPPLQIRLGPRASLHVVLMEKVNIVVTRRAISCPVGKQSLYWLTLSDP